MKKLLLVLLFPLALFGQGLYVPAKTVFGTVNGFTRPVAGATITVCGPGIGGSPCAPPLANTVFQDSALTIPLSNPLQADANGNYPQFAVAPGTYTVTESAPGYSGFSYQLQISCVSGGACTVGTLTAGSAVISGNISAGSITVGGAFAASTFNATTYQVSGVGQSGTGPLCSTVSCVMTTPAITSAALTTPAIGSAGGTFAGSTSGTTTLKASATASGTLTLPAATDTLMGKATTDIETNKTLITPTSGNNVTLIDAQDNAAGITGTGSPIVFYTKTIAASTVATGKIIHVLASWSHGTGTGSVSYTISLNGVALITLASSATGANQLELQIKNTAATTGNAQGRLNVAFATGASSGEAWGSNQVLAISFTAANTEVITPGMTVADLIQ